MFLCTAGPVVSDPPGVITDWPDGALHEQPALDYATRRDYDGTVLPMPGKAYKGSPQHLRCRPRKTWLVPRPLQASLLQ